MSKKIPIAISPDSDMMVSQEELDFLIKNGYVEVSYKAKEHYASLMKLIKKEREKEGLVGSSPE